MAVLPVQPGLRQDIVRIWLVSLTGAAILVGAGIFFAFEGTGKAGQYASIASFFLALPVAAGSIVSLNQTRSKMRAADKEDNREPASPNHAVTVRDSTGIQLGDGNYMHVEVTSTSTGHQQVRRNRKKKQQNR